MTMIPSRNEVLLEYYWDSEINTYAQVSLSLHAIKLTNFDSYGGYIATFDPCTYNSKYTLLHTLRNLMVSSKQHSLSCSWKTGSSLVPYGRWARRERPVEMQRYLCSLHSGQSNGTKHTTFITLVVSIGWFQIFAIKNGCFNKYPSIK